MSRYISDIIKYFFHHQTSAELRDKVHQRLAQTAEDADCDTAYHELWDETKPETMSEEEIDEAYKRLEQTIFVPKRASRHLNWVRIAAIWFVPILLLGAATYMFITAKQKEDFYESIEYVHHFTSYGEQEEVTLPDGSKVWLNSGSLLIYPTHFSKTVRKVCLSGEAYFDVAKDADKPFYVDINQLQLKVLGTSFNVSAFPDNPELTTTLSTGKVQVDVNKTGDKYILKPNQQLVYNVKTGMVDIHDVDTKDHGFWRSGAIYINNLGLIEAAKVLERSYNVNIHILTSNYQDQKLRVHFNRQEDIGHVMEIMKMLIPELTYEIQGKNIYIH